MMDARLLVGKNAIVTGSARGIGNKIIEIFAANGANVWACARNRTEKFEENAKALSEQYKVQVMPVYFDFEDQEQMKVAVKKIISAKIPVDILVNNAGLTYNALYQMSTMDNIKKIMEVNFIAQYIFTQYIVKLMVRNHKGSIVNISSSAGLDGNSGRSVYGASKAGVICSTKALAAELGVQGIRANSIAPGITQTEMLSSMTEDIIAETISKTDMKRAGTPKDIANAVLFLASDLSSYITGQVLRVDGGM